MSERGHLGTPSVLSPVCVQALQDARLVESSCRKKHASAFITNARAFSDSAPPCKEMDFPSNFSNASASRQEPIWSESYLARNLVLGTSGTVLNVVTMAAIVHDRSGMASSFRMLLLSLALTDLGAMLVSVASSVLVCYHVTGKTLCKVFVTCFYLCVDCTAVTTFLISAERGAAILLPHRYRVYAVSRRKLAAMVISTWLLSSALVAASLTGGFENRFKCIPVNSATKGGVVLQGLLQLGTALGVGAIYLAIAVKLRYSVAKSHRTMPRCDDTLLDPSPSLSTSHQRGFGPFHPLLAGTEATKSVFSKASRDLSSGSGRLPRHTRMPVTGACLSSPEDDVSMEAGLVPHRCAAGQPLIALPSNSSCIHVGRSLPRRDRLNVCELVSGGSQSTAVEEPEGTFVAFSRKTSKLRPTALTRTQLRLTLYAGILAVWFCLAYLPFGVYYIWMVGAGADRGREVNSTRNLVMSFFPFANSLINPFLFFWHSRRGSLCCLRDLQTKRPAVNNKG